MQLEEMREFKTKLINGHHRKLQGEKRSIWRSVVAQVIKGVPEAS